ncbi:hypothetical protein FJT64_010409 [Amphibalanus amphitrite]|uniref:Uncharacterized protein n=1 Tax=Amphibalanus amphitrite TaxID=1232801 RepID=A0A6A4VIX9_AMPAM|nr:hypothetical protein FJT64_010409 [Amphibalanus amphitrite]
MLHQRVTVIAGAPPGDEDGGSPFSELQGPPPTVDGGPVRVLTLLKINDIDVGDAAAVENHSLCTVSGWLHVEWSDPRVCRPSNARVTLGRAWRPDLRVLNSASEAAAPLIGDQTEALVLRHGWLLATVRVQCRVRVTKHDSGSHAVRLRLGSHLLTSEDVMFHPLDEAVDVTHLTGNDRFGARRTSLVADTFQARHFGGEFVTFSSIVATIVF